MFGMEESLKEKLIFLADKYETHDFIKNDPAQFLYYYPKEQIVDVEIAALIAAMLAFGNRKQFIPKIRWILELADKTTGTVSAWIMKNAPGFPYGREKFYRFYSYDDIRIFFNEISLIIKKKDNLGKFFFDIFSQKNVFKENNGDSLCFFLDQLVVKAFPKSKIVPKGRTSANKRIQLFLRWMVRQNSSVDLGIWDWYSPSNLLIPLDTHVLQEAVHMGLLDKNEKATRKTVLKLTSMMSEVFPGDPCRADYSLFGLGVDYPHES